MQKVIEMALKLLFLPQNHKNRPAAGGFVIRGLNQTIFGQKILLLVKAPFPLCNILVALLVAFTAADRFFKRLYGPHTKRAKKRCRPYASLFSDVNTKLLK